MKYSETTGQHIPSEFEQRDMDIADDDLRTILSLKTDLNDLLYRIGGLVTNGTLHITHNALRESGLVMHEQLDELLTKDYNRLLDTSCSVFFPTTISEASKKESL